jgi:hypothetical protein
MPKSQHPYFVCTREHPLTYQGILHDAAEDQEQHIHEYEIDYRINDAISTKIDAGLHRIDDIRKEFLLLNSKSYIHYFKSAEIRQEWSERLTSEINTLAPTNFLNSFRTLSAEHANAWPNILWHCTVTETTVSARSQDQSHSLSFSFKTEQETTSMSIRTVMIVSVKYRGPFQLEPIPQYEYEVDHKLIYNEVPDTPLYRGLHSIYMNLDRMQQILNNSNFEQTRKQSICDHFISRIQYLAPRIFLFVFHIRSQDDADAWLNIRWNGSYIHATSVDLRHIFSFSWNLVSDWDQVSKQRTSKKLIRIRYIGPIQLDVI